MSSTPNMSTEKFHSDSPPTSEEISDSLPKHSTVSSTGAPPFVWSSLWSAPVLNPLNMKSYTLPILNLRTPYGRNFHLAWLGFFVAFLSWFAFPPLLPEAITADLKLTKVQIANSNIVALSSTLIMRLILGPMVDRFGPRKVMAGILVAGAIPSGMAGLVTSYRGLYAIRFFIGILGGTFVPCITWTTAFFDREVVGTANALVGGWGNAGGGATYAIMVSLYSRLHKHMSQHKAWRVAFAVVPVPILLLTAALTLIFGTDHPAGQWANRHNTPATALAIMQGEDIQLDASEQAALHEKKNSQSAEVQEVNEDDPVPESKESVVVRSKLDVVTNEPLTWRRASGILLSPLTWLPALAYMSTFGFELAVDSNLAFVLLAAHPSLLQLNAGYLASVFGLLNIFTRPFGGYLADRLYSRFGLKAKKYLTLSLGILQGVFCIGFGQLLKSGAHPSLAGLMVLIVLMAIVNEMANGSNFSLVPHCFPASAGSMTGLVGAFGNLGGIIFALIFRFQPKQGHGWVIAGAVALGVNCILIVFPSPKN